MQTIAALIEAQKTALDAAGQLTTEVSAALDAIGTAVMAAMTAITANPIHDGVQCAVVVPIEHVDDARAVAGAETFGVLLHPVSGGVDTHAVTAGWWSCEALTAVANAPIPERVLWFGEGRALLAGMGLEVTEVRREEVAF